MKNDKFIETFNDIDPKFIDEAKDKNESFSYETLPRKNERASGKYILFGSLKAAACLAVICAVAVSAVLLAKGSSNDLLPNRPDDNIPDTVTEQHTEQSEPTSEETAPPADTSSASDSQPQTSEQTTDIFSETDTAFNEADTVSDEPDVTEIVSDPLQSDTNAAGENTDTASVQTAAVSTEAEARTSDPAETSVSEAIEITEADLSDTDQLLSWLTTDNRIWNAAGTPVNDGSASIILANGGAVTPYAGYTEMFIPTEAENSIYCLRDGVVASAGCYDESGNTVCVRYSDGTCVEYCHLSEIYVQQGDNVTKNQILGCAGCINNDTHCTACYIYHHGSHNHGGTACGTHEACGEVHDLSVSCNGSGYGNGNGYGSGSTSGGHHSDSHHGSGHH